MGAQYTVCGGESVSGAGTAYCSVADTSVAAAEQKDGEKRVGRELCSFWQWRGILFTLVPYVANTGQLREGGEYGERRHDAPVQLDAYERGRRIR